MACMNRTTFIDLLRRISSNKYQDINDALLSKSLGFYFLKKFIDTPTDDLDIWNADVDSTNDRGLDYVYINDSSDESIKIYLLQCKYSENGNYSIDENEVSKFLLNCNKFPDLTGNVNDKLTRKINDCKLIQNREDGPPIEKYLIYVNLGQFTANALDQLQSSGVDIYDFDRFNSELLLDENLPDLPITFNQAPLKYNDSTLLGILSAKPLLDSADICKMIQNQSIFHYNVRGLMKNRKNSIADDIKATLKDSPQNFFIRNNGITIICESIEKESETAYHLCKASIINGQQTIRALHSYWGSLNDSQKSAVYMMSKIIAIDPRSAFSEIKVVAKASNKQNPIKESDLFANEQEQTEIEEKSRLLPAPLSFEYARKRTVDYPENPNVISRDEATLLLSLFYNHNPSDRIEGLYKYNYKQIFEGIQPEHIAIVRKLRKMIEDKHNIQDQNNPATQIWSGMFYVRFKKNTVINFCLYLFSELLAMKYNVNDRTKRLSFIQSVFNKMTVSQNYDIDTYFNKELWVAYQTATYRYLRPIYDDPNSTSDALRKEPNLQKFIQLYEDFVAEKAIEGQFQPAIIV